MQRGGMRPRRQASRSRTVSPTMPYERDPGVQTAQRLLPEPDLDQDEPMPPSPDSRDVESEHGGRVRMPSEERVAWRARDLADEENLVVWHADDPPPAQANVIRRPVMDRDECIAHVWAAPQVKAAEALDYLNEKLNLIQDLKAQPRFAEYWEEIRSLEAPRKVYIDCERPIEIRRGPWEVRQVPKVIPILQRDLIAARFISSQQLSVRTTQSRIDDQAHHDEILVLITVGNQWHVIAHLMPLAIRSRLQALEETLERVARGGPRRHNPAYHEPRSAVIGWSLQRALQCVPEANPQTVGMLLKAEFRCATAIMGCRTERQVRESLTAAYRRAGLQAPSEEQQQQAGTQQNGAEEEAQSQPVISMDRERGEEMVRTLTTQTEMMRTLTHIAEDRSTQELKDLALTQARCLTQMATFQRDLAQSVMENIRGMCETYFAQNSRNMVRIEQKFQELHERMGSWETNHLAEILDRLPPGGQRSPETEEMRSIVSEHNMEGEEERVQQQEREQGRENEEEIDEAAGHDAAPEEVRSQMAESTQEYDSAEDMPVSSVLENLRQRSERAQQRRAGTAMQPFRARQ